MNPFTSAIVRGMLESGDLEKHVHELIETYRPRLQTMDSMLRQHLNNLAYTAPQGGYFFWLRLPEPINAIELRQRAKTFHIDFRQGTLFAPTGKVHNYIRLCFAYYDEAHITEGIQRLKTCLTDN